MVYKIFNKKTGVERSVNEELARELHKPVIEKFKRRKVYARFEGNTWAADLAEMVSLSSFNLSVKQLLCVIDVFTKYTWIEPLKGRKAKSVPYSFIEIVNGCKRQPNKLWVDQGK